MGLALKKRFDEKNPEHLKLLKKYGLDEKSSSSASAAAAAEGGVARSAAARRVDESRGGESGSSMSAAAATTGISPLDAKEKARHEQIRKNRMQAEEEDEKHRMKQEVIAATFRAEQSKIDEEKAKLLAQEQAILAQVTAQMTAAKLKIVQQQKELNEKTEAARAALDLQELEVAKKRVKIEPDNYFPSNKKLRYSTDLTDEAKPVVWSETVIETDAPIPVE